MMTRLKARVFEFLTTLAMLLLAPSAFADIPRDKALGFQAPVTPVMERIEWFHNYILVPVCVVIVLLVMLLLIWCMIRYNRKSNPTAAGFHHNTLLEVVWTGIPVLILVLIAIPSFNLLAYEEITPPSDLTIKAMGSQWYWDYEYPTSGDFTFTSKLLPKADAEAQNRPYKLAVTEPIYVPVNATVRVLVTGMDVIHSWAVPAFGVKMDAVPGRINDTWFRATKEGIYYGQCSELCGADHAFMPIEVHVVSKPEFDAWVATMKQKYSALETAPATQVAENR
ncbi:MAG: cytochrome c oxidase subunit II [Alphaproteobacteria bacterium]